MFHAEKQNDTLDFALQEQVLLQKALSAHSFPVMEKNVLQCKSYQNQMIPSKKQTFFQA